MKLLRYPAGLRHDPCFDESLLAQAASDGPVAALWEARQCLVVPRTYRRHAAFAAACQASAEQGWPVVVRQSGGGLVPQGDGMLNLSLALPCEERPLDASDRFYRLLCDLIQDAAADLGVTCAARAVEGSFCDGRYNLAVGPQDDPRKVVGTAQLWRRLAPATGGPAIQVVLVHGLIVSDADTDALTARLNAFEQMLGTQARYLPQRITAMHRAAGGIAPPLQFRAALADALADRLQELASVCTDHMTATDFRP